MDHFYECRGACDHSAVIGPGQNKPSGDASILEDGLGQPFTVQNECAVRAMGVRSHLLHRPGCALLLAGTVQLITCLLELFIGYGAMVGFHLFDEVVEIVPFKLPRHSRGYVRGQTGWSTSGTCPLGDVSGHGDRILLSSLTHATYATRHATESYSVRDQAVSPLRVDVDVLLTWVKIMFRHSLCADYSKVPRRTSGNAWGGTGVVGHTARVAKDAPATWHA